MIVENIRQLKGAAVLADRKPATPSLNFKRHTLIYGFNGSGKSTLSRIFAALQYGKKIDRLPEGCTFEIATSDGKTFSYPDALTGLEKRVCVFSQDFINENLRWEAGAANPIFYIGATQAEAAEQLKALEATLPAAQTKQEGEAKLLKEREKGFGEYKRNLARTVSERLRQAARYEATQFVADVEKLGASAADILKTADLDAAIATCARSEPPAKVKPVEIPISALMETMQAASELAPKPIGAIVVEGLKDHPQMVPWAQQGHQYHTTHDLTSCLYCGEKISNERKKLLTAAFDGQFSEFVTNVSAAADSASACVDTLAVARAAIPAAAQLSAEFQPPFEAAALAFNTALDEINPLLMKALNALLERKATPTSPATLALPPLEEIKSYINVLEKARDAVNAICKQHSDMVDDFVAHQKGARESIRRHFVAESAEDYAKHLSSVSDATAKDTQAKTALEKLEADIIALRSKVQEHGPAADKINSLVKSYLGHGELTIVAVPDGYELHRRGTLVSGPPSEGEKTSIALCYFLSMLEAEGRKVKDLIIVIDDPVSSLDTKAMNFASALIRNRLSEATQLIILTHNQHCMNEFKKFWKSGARADPATASLKFIDVSIPEGTDTRTAKIVDLPKQLRDYESEYHYLFEKVMLFEQSAGGHFDYAFMVPNVLRRVLEIFLAFKVPRQGNISDKIKTLSERYEDLDSNRLNALERLSQVESHSDNLDDLITQSSMTVEESLDANVALIHLMEIVDPDHLSDLRKYAKS